MTRMLEDLTHKMEGQPTKNKGQLGWVLGMLMYKYIYVYIYIYLYIW